jgi:hypothetical protein
MVHNDAVKIELHELAVDVKGSSEGFSSRKENIERRRAEWPPFPFEGFIDPAIWQMREIVLLNMNLVSGIRPGIVEDRAPRVRCANLLWSARATQRQLPQLPPDHILDRNHGEARQSVLADR